MEGREQTRSPPPEDWAWASFLLSQESEPRHGHCSDDYILPQFLLCSEFLRFPIPDAKSTAAVCKVCLED